ncbi:TniQ family protein [Candidatus Methylobacter oryzae]|uniref:TniQ domain-containing protein n=1 Tax=Candidatus Methylobacter oryzae TaxID=2497749 RepID=A0ABY3CCG4_9GAMM|nr:TniQ family protein [Candidatus Methylobacter oryzae]TRW98578.1 hypothetical protein EKO24_007005 [Candidatus Methylobacter oryzae]
MATEKIHSTLPVRPRPIQGEAVVGYLMRLAGVNGYNSIRQFGKIFGSFDGLCQALGLTTEERQVLFGPYPSFWGPSVLSNGLMAADFNHSQLRWCPLCLRESAHLLGSWLLKISCVCKRHATWLQEKCPDCGSFQRLDKVNFEICGCGASLAEIRAAGPVADSVYHLSQTVEASIIGNSAFSGFPPLSLPEWLKLISYLGQFTETCQPRKPGKIANMHQLDTASALLLQTSCLLDSWPENFHALLAAIQRQAESEAKTKTRIRDTFGTLYHVLYTDLSAPCFQFLRDEFERYLHEHWWGVVNKRHRAFKPETVAQHPRVTLKQAAKKAGVAPSTVRHFVRAEVIAGNLYTTMAAQKNGLRYCLSPRKNISAASFMCYARWKRYMKILRLLCGPRVNKWMLSRCSGYC